MFLSGLSEVIARAGQGENSREPSPDLILEVRGCAEEDGALDCNYVDCAEGIQVVFSGDGENQILIGENFVEFPDMPLFSKFMETLGADMLSHPDSHLAVLASIAGTDSVSVVDRNGDEVTSGRIVPDLTREPWSDIAPRTVLRADQVQLPVLYRDTLDWNA